MKSGSAGIDAQTGLTEQIKRFALADAGFDLVGVSGISLPEFYERAMNRWVGEGYAGGMGYMVRNGRKRAHPEEILLSGKSVISLAVNYYHPEDQRPIGGPVGRVAKYAYGVDYHAIIEKKLKRLSRFIIESSGPGTQLKAYVDTGPILEKAFAQRAGLGFFGKNTNIITCRYGSWVFLAAIITNLELKTDEPHPGGCGSCRRCIDACPTGALLGEYRLDARRCISYLTIESKEEIPEALRRDVGRWVFGCDVCQDVCPYNRRAKTTNHREFYPEKRAGTWIDLNILEEVSDDAQLRRRFPSSPLWRAKQAGLLRNAKVAIENLILEDQKYT